HPFDLERPVYDFTQRLLAAVDGKVPANVLKNAERELLRELAPRVPPSQDPPRLKIERYSMERAFAPMLPSGGEPLIEFEPGRHSGRLVVEGLADDPVAVYALITRDPAVIGQHLWDFTWGETVRWLPSPFHVVRCDDQHIIMDNQPVQPIPGHYFVTAVLVLDRALIGALDPRGPQPPKAVLDELETSRFLTNLRRLMKRNPTQVAVASNEYKVL